MRHSCEQGTRGMPPRERCEGVYLHEEVGGQPRAFWVIWRHIS